ncbi:MAG TPA: GTPase domain-containing protein [Myxococcota bacterium]|nr:GTPase domain-containing protein [Myxococcota bacterium]
MALKSKAFMVRLKAVALFSISFPLLSADVSVAEKVESEDPITLILVGSTRVGKSSLANFLVKPEAIINNNEELFAVGHDMSPTTEEVHCHRFLENGVVFEVVDTAGLNASGIKDKEHMIDLIDQMAGKPRCIIVLCHRFGSTIDMQTTNTIRHFADTFGAGANWIVVMTNYQTDNVSMEQRSRDSIDPESIKQQFGEHVQKTAKLKAIPHVFLIDSRPDDPELLTSKSSRNDIMTKAKSMHTEAICHPRFRKTHEIVHEDRLKQRYQQGRTHGYIQEDIRHYAIPTYVVEEWEAILKEATEKSQNLHPYEKEANTRIDALIQKYPEYRKPLENWRILLMHDCELVKNANEKHLPLEQARNPPASEDL